MPTVLEGSTGNNLLTIVKQKQIANYVNHNDTLIYNVHITRHAGTSTCSIMSKLGPTPGFICIEPCTHEGIDDKWPSNTMKTTEISTINDTAKYVSLFRPYFHYVSNEYRGSSKDLRSVNWEYENLVSMIVMRDPIEQFLAGGKCRPWDIEAINGYDPTNETQDLYWEYAIAVCSDNYALRVLAGNKHCVAGANTTVACLGSAKTLLNRFTFIIDQACLSDSMVALGSVLHLDITEKNFEGPLHHKHALSTRERITNGIGNDTLYDFLQH